MCIIIIDDFDFDNHISELLSDAQNIKDTNETMHIEEEVYIYVYIYLIVACNFHSKIFHIILNYVYGGVHALQELLQKLVN